MLEGRANCGIHMLYPSWDNSVIVLQETISDTQHVDNLTDPEKRC
jgi:hypothetical protein